MGIEGLNFGIDEAMPSCWCCFWSFIVYMKLENFWVELAEADIVGDVSPTRLGGGGKGGLFVIAVAEANEK